MPWNRTDGGLYADHDGKGGVGFPSFKGTNRLSFGVGRKVAGSKDREVLAVQQGDVGADNKQRTRHHKATTCLNKSWFFNA